MMKGKCEVGAPETWFKPPLVIFPFTSVRSKAETLLHFYFMLSLWILHKFYTLIVIATVFTYVLGQSNGTSSVYILFLRNIRFHLVLRLGRHGRRTLANGNIST